MSTALELKKEKEEHINSEINYEASEEDKAASDYFDERKNQLKEHRKKYEKIWKAADKAYIPHTLKTEGKKVLASDDELGWRSTQVILGSDKWQEDSVPPNPYIKVQTALGILVDRNPTGVFSPGSKKYQKNTKLVENLYTRSWEIAKSKQQLKNFIFNQAKYGFAVARTFPLKIERNGFTYYDDVFRENLNPWTVWIDDMAKPGNRFSTNDWMFYKDYGWEKFKEQFGHLDNFKYVKPSSSAATEEGEEQKEVEQDKIRIWFYENLARDTFYVETDDGVTLVNEPLPQEKKNKRLTCWFALWTLRSAEEIIGIGIYEAMRNDYKIYTKVRNMSIDQLVLSIYKEFFYEGSDTLENDGQMVTKPGRGRQVVNPQNVRWNEVPGPGREAMEWMEHLEKRQEKDTGITETLEGQIVGKTAFESAQAREMALRRMKTPLDNITDALETEAYITLGIMEDLYSLPKVEQLAEPRFIEEWDETTQDFKDVEETEQEVPREIPLKLEKDEQGNITETEEDQFFEVLPEDLPWEGMITVKAQSILAQSELLERTTKLEMANMLLPLFGQPVELVGKAAKQIIKSYKEDPKDWLPDAWLQEQQKPLFTQMGGGQPEAGGETGGQAEKIQPSTEIRPQRGSVNQMISKINPFK